MKLLHGMKDEALSYSNNIKLLTTKLDQCILYIYQQERAYSGTQVSPAWRLDREMRRRFILQET